MNNSKRYYLIEELVLHLNDIMVTMDRDFCYRNPVGGGCKKIWFDNKSPFIVFPCTIHRLPKVLGKSAELIIDIDTANHIRSLCDYIQEVLSIETRSDIVKSIGDSQCNLIKPKIYNGKDVKTEVKVRLSDEDKYFEVLDMKDWPNSGECKVAINIQGLIFKQSKNKATISITLAEIKINVRNSIQKLELIEYVSNIGYRNTMRISTLFDCIDIPKNINVHDSIISTLDCNIHKVLITNSMDVTEYDIEVVDIETGAVINFNGTYEIGSSRHMHGNSYLYFLSPGTYSGYIYKVGITEKHPHTLYERYGKNTFIYLLYPTRNMESLEYTIKHIFKRKYVKAKGDEYFVGEYLSMIYDIIHIIGCFS